MSKLRPTEKPSATGKAADEAFRDSEARIYALSRSYLGGKKFSPCEVSGKVDVHSAIVKGVPYGASVANPGHRSRGTQPKDLPPP